ncbi:MAG: pantoate--beta-alanine ligase [Beijerinckiaceae bacterium]
MKCNVVRDVNALRTQVAQWRGAAESVALVPTMGALHAGHLALVTEATKRAHRVVLSIFVNPMQFAPTEDFEAYPRSLEADVEKFAAAGGDLVFAPGVGSMYGPGFATTVNVAGPATAGLEDKFRPDHFAGVATVVAKLLNQCRPDVALFGEKDFQQLKVITRMAQDLDLETEIFGVPTLREPDGLAMSSRNLYLSGEERKTAALLNATLVQCATELRNGESVAAALERARQTLAAAGFGADYVEARHADTLAPVAALGEGLIRLLAAARLGKTRLIDNIEV